MPTDTPEPPESGAEEPNKREAAASSLNEQMEVADKNLDKSKETMLHADESLSLAQETIASVDDAISS